MESSNINICDSIPIFSNKQTMFNGDCVQIIYKYYIKTKFDKYQIISYFEEEHLDKIINATFIKSNLDCQSKHGCTHSILRTEDDELVVVSECEFGSYLFLKNQEKKILIDTLKIYVTPSESQSENRMMKKGDKIRIVSKEYIQFEEQNLRIVSLVLEDHDNIFSDSSNVIELTCTDEKLEATTDGIIISYAYTSIKTHTTRKYFIESKDKFNIINGEYIGMDSCYKLEDTRVSDYRRCSSEICHPRIVKLPDDSIGYVGVCGKCDFMFL